MPLGDFATIPAMPMGYPMTVTSCPGVLGDFVSGKIARLRTRSVFSARKTARSVVFETEAGDNVTGVGEFGKNTTRLSRVATAPRRIRASDSESPYQGSAT